MSIDLSGRVTIETAGDDAIARYVRRQFAPFRDVPQPPGPALRVVPAERGARTRDEEVQGPAQDGIHSGTDGTDMFVTWDRRRCTVPDVLAGESDFRYEPGFPMWRLLRTALRPASQILPAVAGNSVAAHAAAVTLDDAAILVAGWSESGKTETALALMERGASFLSDKWTFVGREDLEASAFPISVGVRRWVLPYLPTLQAATTPASRVQFLGARAAAGVLRPVAARGAGSRRAAVIPDIARAVADLGDRAAYEIDELRSAYGQSDDPLRRAPLRTLVVLRTITANAVRVRDVAPRDAAARLARTAAYERRPYLNLLDRFAYLDPRRAAGAPGRAVDVDEAVLRDVCGSVRLLEIECPFPVDPGRVADAILEAQ